MLNKYHEKVLQPLLTAFGCDEGHQITKGGTKTRWGALKHEEEAINDEGEAKNYKDVPISHEGEAKNYEDVPKKYEGEAINYDG